MPKSALFKFYMEPARVHINKAICTSTTNVNFPLIMQCLYCKLNNERLIISPLVSTAWPWYTQELSQVLLRQPVTSIHATQSLLPRWWDLWLLVQILCGVQPLLSNQSNSLVLSTPLYSAVISLSTPLFLAFLPIPDNSLILPSLHPHSLSVSFGSSSLDTSLSPVTGGFPSRLTLQAPVHTILFLSFSTSAVPQAFSAYKVKRELHFKDRKK